MAWAHDYDISYPDGSTLPVSILDNAIINVKQAIQERLNSEHKFDLDGTQVSDTDTGKHRKITFYDVLSSKPTLEDDEVALYSKDVGGTPELFFEANDGTEKQLTTEGALNLTAAEIVGILTNDTYFTAIDEAGTGTVNLIKAGRNEADDTDVAVLPDETRLATDAAPTEDTQIPNKMYVDDQITAAVASLTLGAASTVDSSSNTLAMRANLGTRCVYKAPVAGVVTGYIGLQNTGYLKGLTGTTTSPSLLADYAKKESALSSDITGCVQFLVAANEYFEVEHYDGIATGVVYWRPFGTGAPIKQ